MKIPVRIQMTPGENGASALYMMLGHFGRYVSMEELRKVCIISRNGSSPQQILDAAKYYGLDGELAEISAEQLKKESLPILVFWKKRYYAIVTKIRGDLVTVIDPAKGEYRLSFEKFSKIYSGKALKMKPSPEFKPGGKKESLMSMVMPRLKPLMRPILILAAFSMVGVWLDLALSRTIRAFMDVSVGKHGEYTGVLKYVIDIFGKGNLQSSGVVTLFVMYFFTVVIFVFSMQKTSIVTNTSRKLAARSGSSLFKRVLSQSLPFFEQFSVGELGGRIDANAGIDNTLIQSLAPRVINTAMTVFYFFLLLSYNPIITFLCVGIEILNTLIMLKLQERNAILSRSTATSSNALRSSLLNGMNMIETIKSTGSEKSFFNLWYQSQQNVNENQLNSYALNRSMTMVTNVHSYLLSAIQLFLGAYFISQGKFTLGTLAMFQSLLGNMRNSLSSALGSVNSLQQMRTDIERVDDIVKRPLREEVPLQEGINYDKLDGHIVVSHVNYRYNSGDDLAINDVSLEVKPGQMVAIVGSTGCGKSTLLKLMADMYEPESGEILYSGKKRSEIPDVVFHSSITTVDQEAVVFEDSVYENIRMWDETVENYEVFLAAKDAQILNRISSDRDGFSTFMKENGSNFSGGELQRLELARALAHEPTLLFLDEFTSALDALTEDKVIKSIRNKGTTCVVVAHRLSTIVDCDQIYVMDKGKIVESGTHSELYAMNGLYHKLVGNQ
ncbi:MAG: ATP-binding cassette domain-containing protein [Solobacterium sp.]|nr:ATP-binding cassette domain-containing protein [Solobacterium sp.]